MFEIFKFVVVVFVLSSFFYVSVLYYFSGLRLVYRY